MQPEKELNHSQTLNRLKGVPALLQGQAGKTIAPLKGTPPAKTSSNTAPAIQNDTQRVCIWHTVVESVCDTLTLNRD